MLATLRLISQHPPQYLPTRTLRNLAHKLHLRQVLMPDLLLLHIFQNPLPGSLLVTLGGSVEHDEGLRPLAGPVVGDAEDGAVFDVRLAEQEIFELGGGDADSWELC